jgi:hypothetical protein
VRGCEGAVVYNPRFISYIKMGADAVSARFAARVHKQPFKNQITLLCKSVDRSECRGLRVNGAARTSEDSER